MAAPAQDIRITKTQRALVMAMLSLLSQNSFQKITVNDLCQEALVSRSTFYAHFEDKYSLLHFCLEELGRRMRASSGPLNRRDKLRASAQAVHEHATIYRNIFLADPNRELLQMFRTYFMSMITEVLSQRETAGETPLPGSPEMLAAYHAGGMSALLGWWIENEFPVSVDEMADCQHALLGGLFA